MEAMKQKSRFRWLEECEHNPLARSVDIVVSFEGLWAHVPPGATISVQKKAAGGAPA